MRLNVVTIVFVTLFSLIALSDQTRIGIVGLDTSHALSFAKIINKTKPNVKLGTMRVTAAYPYGSLVIPSSTYRYPENIKAAKEMGIKVVDTLPDLLSQVDAVLLETNDGTRHLEQAVEIFKAGKRVFIDKPIAANLSDTIAIFRASEKYGVPVFSCSSLRFNEKAQAARAGEYGKIFGVDAFSRATREPSHSAFFWYAIHGAEELYTVMGQGCTTVSCMHTPSTDMVVGTWEDGRIATLRGLRGNHGRKTSIGLEAYTEKEGRVSFGGVGGHIAIVNAILEFFKSGIPPVLPAETIELCAFMQAAEESERLGGIPVKIADVLSVAEKIAADKVP